MKDKTQDNPGVIAPPPLIYLSGLLLGLRLQSSFPLPFLPRKLRVLLGSSLLGSAVMLGAMAWRVMRGAGTNINPARPATALVVEGPYRVTRNPLYLGMALIYTGIALLLDAIWAMLLLPVVLLLINRGVIDREERYLERKFGERYIQYKARVKRWL